MRTRFIPENLNVEQLTVDHPTDNIKWFKKSKLIHIISLFTEIPARNKTVRNNFQNNGYVPLNSEKLRQDGIHNYNEYLNYLMECGVIETDNQFIVGQKSRGYRLTKLYHTPVKEAKETGIKRVNLHRYLREIKSRKKYHYLSKYFDDGMLTIDFDQSIDFIGDKLKKSTKENMAHKIMKHNTGFYCISMIHHKDYFFFADETGHRVHTNLTILPKELRQFITYDSQSLSAVDIKNSQPYFSTILFQPKFYEKSSPFNIYDIIPVNSPCKKVKPITQSILRQATPTITLLISLGAAEKQEVGGYVSTVANGLLYERYQVTYNESYNTQITREQAKKKLFLVIYSAEGCYRKEKKVFSSLFPTVSKIFSIFKERYHECLAVLLQRIEAYIILDKACRSISSEYPQIPLFTIHDSIVTLTGYEQKIKPIVEAELLKHIGIQPTINYEYWSNLSHKNNDK